jgi:hypothetical protein
MLSGVFMGKQAKKRNTEPRILSDHKKVRKTLVPPMRQYLGEQGMVSWIDQILPELIWLAMLIENSGVKRGVELGTVIAKSANTILSQEYFAFASSFCLLDDGGKQKLLYLLEEQKCLDEIRRSLKVLLKLYPECPLKFIDDGTEQLIETNNVIAFKETIAKYDNRRAQPAMIIQASVLYFAGICGKLHYFSNVQVPNLEAIISDFDSDVSKHACASVRASVNAFIGHLREKTSEDWPRYFWNRGIEIDPVAPIAQKSDKSDLKLPEQIRRFIELADYGLEERWSKLPKDIYKNYQCEVIGALLARQVTLAKRMARNPDFCDVHIAPILLRVMIDNHITLAWILKDPETRSKQFVLYGLGQEKLFLEHLKVEDKKGSNPDLSNVINAMERWIDTQQYSFLTNVNLGSWSGLDTRKMAEEADCLDLYRYAYIPFSSGIHNMWNHVGRLNLRQSGNPLHKYLLIPGDPEMEPEFNFLLNCAKYLQESFCIVDETFNLQCSAALPYDYWCTLTDEKPIEPASDKG